MGGVGWLLRLVAGLGRATGGRALPRVASHRLVGRVKPPAVAKNVLLVVGVGVAIEVRVGASGSMIMAGRLWGLCNATVGGPSTGRAMSHGLVRAGLRTDPCTAHCVKPGRDIYVGARQRDPAGRFLEEWVSAREDPFDGLLARPRGGGARAAQLPRAPVPPRSAPRAPDDGEVAIRADEGVPQVGEAWGIVSQATAPAPLVSAVGRDRARRDIIVAEGAPPRPSRMPPHMPLSRPSFRLRGWLRLPGHPRRRLGKARHGRRHGSHDQWSPFGVVFDISHNHRVGLGVEGRGALGGLIGGSVAADVCGLARVLLAARRSMGLRPPH